MSPGSDTFSVAMPIAILMGGSLLALIGWLIKNAWSRLAADLNEIKQELSRFLKDHSEHAERLTALETTVADMRSALVRMTPSPFKRRGDKK